MAKLYRAFIYVLLLLPVLLYTAPAVADVDSDLEVNNYAYSVNAGINGGIEIKNAVHYTSSYKVKAKPKIKVRYRSRSVFFDLPPVFSAGQKYFTPESLCLFSYAALFHNDYGHAFRLRGPPAI